MRQLDFYEFAGIVAPGVVLITTSLLAVMEPPVLLEMNLGASAIFIIFAYVIGHILQGIGNWFELAWWKLFGGMPTDWVLNRADPILSADQREQLFLAIEKNEGIGKSRLIEIKRKDWFLLVRSLYVAIQKNGNTERIERFNGNYGLLRGVAISCFASGAIMFSAPGGNAVYGGALAIAGLLSLQRMHRFAKYYARELFLQYLKCV